MLTEIDEPIEAGVVFRKNAVRPVWFFWKGRKYSVKEVSYCWKEKVGDGVIHYFSVFDGINTFELQYDSKLLSWKLGKVTGD